MRETISFYLLFYRRVGMTSDFEERAATKGNQTSHNFIGLQPFTVYVFRIFAVNSFGVSKPSKDSFPIVTHPEGKNCKRKLIFYFFSLQTWTTFDGMSWLRDCKLFDRRIEYFAWFEWIKWMFYWINAEIGNKFISSKNDERFILTDLLIAIFRLNCLHLKVFLIMECIQKTLMTMLIMHVH